MGVGIIGLEPNRLVVSFDGRLMAPQAHQHIAEIGQGRRKIRIERDRPLLAFSRLLETLQLGAGEAEIGMRFSRAWIHLDGAFEIFFCLVEVKAIEFGNAQQMQGIEFVGTLAQYLPAECLGLGVLASLKGGDGRREQGLGQTWLFLKSCVMERPRAKIPRQAHPRMEGDSLSLPQPG